jgi:hypothetical protein
MRNLLLLACTLSLAAMLGATSADANKPLEPGECKGNADCEAPDICFKPTKTCTAPCKIECMEDKPVCGKDGVTYFCGKYEALCYGVKPQHKGECKGECVCPDVYDPVCGSDGETYGNKCLAKCAGIESGSQGSCESPSCDGNDDCPEPKICFPPTQECQLPCEITCDDKDPVCGKDGVTYPCGEADAFCHGTLVKHPGKCEVDPDPCVCPDVYDPVCGKDGETYGNACEAGCAEVEIDYEGECEVDPDPCVCPDIYAPVCGKDWETYGNACEAECAGVDVAYEGACEEPTFCPEICQEDDDDDWGLVELCHRPPGNPSNSHEIHVGGNAVAAHLGHGDSLGDCDDDWDDDDQGDD